MTPHESDYMVRIQSWRHQSDPTGRECCNPQQLTATANDKRLACRSQSVDPNLKP
jgi:hypothetical protein